MRPSSVPILTIFTFLGSVASMQPHHRAVLTDRALVLPRQTTSQFSRVASSSSSSTSTTTTSSTTSTTTSTTTSSSSRTTTSEQPPTSTSTSDTSTSDTSTTEQPSSSLEPSSTRTRSTRTTSSSSSSFAVSDSTDTTLSTPISQPTTSDSTAFTVTAVISRPTDASNDGTAASSPKSFFANKGAVAGTFLVVGLFGTALLLCAGLWVIRKYRRRRNDQTYYDDEYKEFNQDRNGTTPEPTLPTTRDSTFVTPTPASPAPNMIEHLHGSNEPLQNMYYNRAQGQYQRESGEFDPYQAHNAGYPYAYSGDHANHAQYTQYAEHGQQDSGAYAYTPEAGVHSIAPEHHQAVAGPSHPQHQSVDSFYETDPSPPGQAR